MPTVYRIKHIPTGLYFCPSRKIKVKLSDVPSWSISSGAHVYVKSNLSKTGKSYLRKPSVKSMVGTRYYTHLITSYSQLGTYNKGLLLPVLDHEWMVEEVE